MPRRLLLAACALAIVPVFVACGDDDDDADAASPGNTPPANTSTSVAVSTKAPIVPGPASKYSVTIDDIGLAWLTDIRRTFAFDLQSLAATRDVFESETTGQKLLNEWGYVDGYQAAYIPEQRDKGVLTGSYYITIETHRFQTADGAMKAFQYYSQSPGLPPAESVPIGNRSVAFTGYAGKISGSTVNAEFKQIIFARGNVVSIVLTTGAQGFMKMQDAWDLAKIVDEKILGDRSAIEPTPTSNYKTPTPEPKK